MTASLKNITQRLLQWVCLCSTIAMASVTAETLDNHTAPNYSDEASCKSALQQHKDESVKSNLGYASNKTNTLPPLSLLSWNIEKGKNQGWQQDLITFAKQADFVLLQEAVLFDQMQKANPKHVFWSFAKGYTTSDYTSGILIASRSEPVFTCTLKVIEPWLRSPKSSLISVFQQNSGHSIAIVNLHAINFTLGIKAFSEQLEGLQNVLANHQGQLVVAGDFNTWNRDRSETLQSFANALDLTEVKFTPDARTHKFGRALDYIFVRKFAVNQTQVSRVDTSDHNPLNAVLSVSNTL